MTRNRIVILVLLSVLPFAFLVGVGSYHLWECGWLFWAWWPMAICFASAYVLGWHWHKSMRRQMTAEPPPLHYTDRDRLAWKRIEDHIKETEKVSVDDLAGLQLYVDVAQKLTQELAAIYHPGARDPIGKLTIPEMLAVVELASHDLGKMAQTYLPGGHLVTIDNVRQARTALKWYQRANQTYWAVSAVMDPVHTGLRYLAARTGLGKPMELFKDNVFLWLYANYVRQIGHYLVELYSGRLKVGVERYRELRAEQEEPSKPVGRDAIIVLDGDSEAAAEARAVTIAVIGQVKAGKSSLINALLGERRAHTDVIPATRGISRYELRAPAGRSKLVLLDTVGYNQAGPDADQFDATVEAAQQVDLLFLVSHARNPARDADVKLWRELQEWFAERPELKIPPVLLVLTHIDLLTPAMEWAPPYNWRAPARPKETNIAEAAKTAHEQFGAEINAIVPVCSAEGKLYGIKEELVPKMTALLGEARAVAFLRCVSAEADERQLQKVFNQVLAAGKALLSSLVR
jgi:uncharacterized protein